MNRTSVEAVGLVLATLNLDDVYPAQRELLREVLEDAKKSQEAVAQEREACYTIAKFNQANHLEHLTAEQIRARGETK